MSPLIRCLLAFAALVPVLRGEIVLQENVRHLAGLPLGPWVRTGDGTLWAMTEKGALTSRDEGRTWVPRPIFDDARFSSRPERALLRTSGGALLYAFLNEREKVFRWDDRQGGPLAGCRLPVYVMRSADEGKTWDEPKLLQDGWCGAVRQMIQLKSGRVMLVCQQAAANPGRHITINYLSDDEGKTWRASDPIDLGAPGNYAGTTSGLTAATHGGGIEGTVFEKNAGGLKLLLRVPHGYFHELTSRDGVTWTASMPSPIEASDSPGMVQRLQSGRLVLVWNRFREPATRQGRREELSIAFSENDGVTWTWPQIIARNVVGPGGREAGAWLAYPYVFEPAPGRLWISTMQGGLRAELAEADFLVPVAQPVNGRAVRIIMLGDSITRGARPQVAPTQTFPAQVQAALRASGSRVTVHNVGVGGERTDLALTRLERDVISQRPDLVTVMYGTNDGWVDQGKSAVRLPLARYADNLRTIVARLRAAGAQVVLMTPPRFGEENPRNGLGEDPNERLANYADACRRVATETGTPLVDHFGAWTEAQARGRRLQTWTTDGCHPNADGHADLAQRLLGVLAPLVTAIDHPL